MEHRIKTVYLVHHSHTDIGYTDLQERVVEAQTDYIRTAVSLLQDPANRDFRWNCETLFCVEQFFKNAAEEEKAAFLRLAEEGRIGLSANYLNFTDLAEAGICRERLHEWQQILHMKTAMMADINGISMGYRDAMIDEGVEFLFTNIHCHHGMYPLRKNQTAYRWENAEGKSLLVWNGEHYMLANFWGFQPSRWNREACEDQVGTIHKNLSVYLTQCAEEGYPYDFIVSGISGVYSDNAPPEPAILRTIEEYESRYGDEGVRFRMVSLQELYAAIAPKLRDAPVLKGDLNDWWANGIGSTPYAVKHFLDARRRYQLCERLDPDMRQHDPELVRTAQDNLLLYAEHTWGHSSTITNPYDTMVLNLDMRKTSYASKAHEAASLLLSRIAHYKGDVLRYYSTCGAVRVCNPGRAGGLRPVDFYVESPIMDRAEIRDITGRVIPCQVSPHPRGRMISFVDAFAPGEEKTYDYRELPGRGETENRRKCYVGAESVRDIVSDYDPVTYLLPTRFENDFFRLEYRIHEGIVSFVDKKAGAELLGEGAAPFFTPLYEVTPVHAVGAASARPENEQRRRIGRNIRGAHAQLHTGHLENVICEERGPVFTVLRLCYSLPGTVRADVYLKLYEAMPRIDFTLKLGKTISSDIESVFLPLTLNYPDRRLIVRKGGAEAFMPGTEQLPGTCIEYWMTDDGVAFLHENGAALISTYDVPLVYMGEMRHHPIRLCENKPEDNRRPVYSWVMNNTWETNFKMDLSGFCEFQYSLTLTEPRTAEEAMDELHETCWKPYVLITRQD